MTGSADHILSLVNGLLDFHRLESGQMEIQNVPFSVRTLFNEIYGSFRPIAEAKGLAFVLNMKEEGMDRIYSGDPIRLRQIVSNLLSNAVKFTHEGRIVLIVKLSIVNSQLTITVSDSGVGIPEEEQEKIFGNRKGRRFRSRAFHHPQADRTDGRNLVAKECSGKRK